MSERIRAETAASTAFFVAAGALAVACAFFAIFTRWAD
jgi:hypothetical protein